VAAAATLVGVTERLVVVGDDAVVVVDFVVVGVVVMMTGVEQLGIVTRLESRVTAPFRASNLPSTEAPVVAVIEVGAGP
jgi:hypothetical protein